MESLAPRRPETVRELEALQQAERASVGEPRLTTDDHLPLLRHDIQARQIAAALDRGGLSEAIRSVDPGGRTDAQVDELLRAWRIDDPAQWSRHELPGTRWGIADLCARVEAVYARHGWRLPEAPVVGTLTTGQVSAATQKTSAGAPIVLIDNGFFRFAGLLAQIAVFATHDANTRGDFSDAVLQLVCDLAATQTVLGSCLHVPARKTPAAFQPRVDAFRDAVGLFVIAHEYAHVHAGDLDAHPLADDAAARGRHAKEYEADKLGFIVALEATRQTGAQGAEGEQGAGVFGPFLYLAGLDLLGRAAAAYEGRDMPEPISDEATDYPTPYERTKNLLDWLGTTPYAPVWHEQIRAASRAYHTVLFAWDRVLAAFSAARVEMAAYSPERVTQPVLPEVVAFGLLQALWRRVKMA